MVLVDFQHTSGGRKGEGRALVPEADPVVLHQKRPERVADLVGVVGVGDVEAHEHQLFHVGDRVDSELLERAVQKHERENDVRFQQKTVDRPTVQLQRTVGAAHPHGDVRGRGNCAEVRAVLLDVDTEAVKEVCKRPSSHRYGRCAGYGSLGGKHVRGGVDGLGSLDGFGCALPLLLLSFDFFLLLELLQLLLLMLLILLLPPVYPQLGGCRGDFLHVFAEAVFHTGGEPVSIRQIRARNFDGCSTHCY